MQSETIRRRFVENLKFCILLLFILRNDSWAICLKLAQFPFSQIFSFDWNIFCYLFLQLWTIRGRFGEISRNEFHILLEKNLLFFAREELMNRNVNNIVALEDGVTKNIIEWSQTKMFWSRTHSKECNGRKRYVKRKEG